MIEPYEIDTASPVDLREFARVSRILAQMAELRAMAYEYRLAGRIVEASAKESAVEMHYARLPEDVKW